jgi:divinyl protochlorophyllide a 8-vinyl-reductase
VLDRAGGPGAAARLMARAGLAGPPDGSAMIPEQEAAALHRQLRRDAPDLAGRLSAEAGDGTARYILAHRIPRPAQTVLGLLPPPLAARALSKAIARHAWTFAGSGAFRAVDPWCFEIAANPLVDGENSETPLCAWHAAVFERLYRSLVAPDCRCVETRCCAQPGGGPCRFELSRVRRG